MAAILIGVLATPLAAVQDLSGAEREIEIHDLACVAKEDNSVVYAEVRGARPGDTVRLYFRRLHHYTEDFYYVLMEPVRENAEAQNGRHSHLYAGVLPKPRDKDLKRIEKEDGEERWARWWREKDDSENRNPGGLLKDTERIDREATEGGTRERTRREWMDEEEWTDADQTLQEWLETQKNEPVEYYAVFHDAAGTRLNSTRTRFRRTEVWSADCPGIDLVSAPAAWHLDETDVARFRGRTEVLTIGETADWQRGHDVFHWKCDGIVTRIDPRGVYRPDEVCRACVFIMPLWLVGLSAVPGAASVIDIVAPPPASQSSP